MAICDTSEPQAGLYADAGFHDGYGVYHYPGDGAGKHAGITKKSDSFDLAIGIGFFFLDLNYLSTLQDFYGNAFLSIALGCSDGIPLWYTSFVGNAISLLLCVQLGNSCVILSSGNSL
jgi:hypothetical protein